MTLTMTDTVIVISAGVGVSIRYGPKLTAQKINETMGAGGITVAAMVMKTIGRLATTTAAAVIGAGCCLTMGL